MSRRGPVKPVRRKSLRGGAVAAVGKGAIVYTPRNEDGEEREVFVQWRSTVGERGRLHAVAAANGMTVTTLVRNALALYLPTLKRPS